MLRYLMSVFLTSLECSSSVTLTLCEVYSMHYMKCKVCLLTTNFYYFTIVESQLSMKTWQQTQTFKFFTWMFKSPSVSFIFSCFISKAIVFERTLYSAVNESIPKYITKKHISFFSKMFPQKEHFRNALLYFSVLKEYYYYCFISWGGITFLFSRLSSLSSKSYLCQDIFLS